MYPPPSDGEQAQHRSDGGGPNRKLRRQPISRLLKSRLLTALRKLHAGQWEDAWKELDDASPAEQQHTTVLQLRITILEALGYWDAAFEMATNLITSGHREPFVYVLGAIAAHELQSPDAALQYLANGAPYCSSAPSFLFLRASLNAEKGDFTSARKDLGAAFEGDGSLRLKAIEQPEFEPLWDWVREEHARPRN